MVQVLVPYEELAFENNRLFFRHEDIAILFKNEIEPEFSIDFNIDTLVFNLWVLPFNFSNEMNSQLYYDVYSSVPQEFRILLNAIHGKNDDSAFCFVKMNKDDAMIAKLMWSHLYDD